MSNVIDMDSLPGEVTSRALALGADTLTAFARAVDDQVTYVYAGGKLVACIAPPEAGERFEHAAETQDQGAGPVLLRTERRARRRAWFTWGPFEGIF